MQATEKITLVLRPHAGYTIADLQQYAKLGMPAGVGRSLGVIAGASEGDLMERIEQLESQVILAESAMRRGALMHDRDHLPALHRVIDHVPTLYLEVADQIKQTALDDGDDASMAEEAAGQAIRVLVLFKQRLEKMLEPDLLTATPAAVSKPETVVAETPYAQVRVTNIDEWIRTVKNASRYEWLRDVAFDTPRQDLALRDRHQNILIEAELDAEIDRAMRAYPSEGDQEDWSGPSPETLQALESIASRHPLASAETVDPRNLFASINPIGASADELEQGRNGFVDERTHADYLIFLAGYRAAQEAVQCAD